MKSEKIQKFMARCGVGSRRFCEREVDAGRVLVNGTTAHLGDRVTSEDRVIYQGELLAPEDIKEVWLLNKPVGVVTTLKDPFAEHTLVNLLPVSQVRLVPVGRLDKDSCGLLLLTNNGELVYALTHPRHEVQKVYEVVIRGGSLSRTELKKFESGVMVDGYKTRPCKIEWLNLERYRVSLKEGRNRQIRKMFEYFGKTVCFLQRLSLGPILLGDLPVGEARKLTEVEVQELYQAAEVDA